MAQLNVKQHTLIQALLLRGPLKENEFHGIFTGLTGKNPATHQQLFDDYLLKINKGLSYAQLELRGCRHQYDGQIYYGVVNNVSDEQSKLGTKYSVPQIAFYKAIIEAIVQDDTAQGSISNIAALNLRLENQVLNGTGSQSQGGYIPALRNFSATQKEKTLRELLRDQWLKQTPDGKIGLGIRSFLDLRSWFRNNDVPSCEACNEAGVKAQLCQNEDCTVRIHHYCLNNMFSQRKGGRVCPRCGTQWQYEGPKEEAVEEDDKSTMAASSRAPPAPKRKKPRIDDASEWGSSQASVPSSQPRRVTRSSASAR
ncbi:non-structural maintenance of chromosomes element 1 homolog isoform X1 [Morus notabilis]|uniref:non-structural maintenance of chromosomes element 1 homolog isoform X1 n=1 Tax=Morus notabilis TaxID=981085 RepID=UPI000CED3223|nr:non-structural maintenance of chromosomes element 1 homolog isoform X1 [Morus notabilis]